MIRFGWVSSRASSLTSSSWKFISKFQNIKKFLLLIVQSLNAKHLGDCPGICPELEFSPNSNPKPNSPSKSPLPEHREFAFVIRHCFSAWTNTRLKSIYRKRNHFITNTDSLSPSRQVHLSLISSCIHLRFFTLLSLAFTYISLATSLAYQKFAQVESLSSSETALIAARKFNFRNRRVSFNFALFRWSPHTNQQTIQHHLTGKPVLIVLWLWEFCCD